MTIQIDSRGRRHYLIGNTFPIKNAIKAAGCRWDPEAKAWWTGKRETADALVSQLVSKAAKPKREAPGPDAAVAGRCTYKGHTYYLAGRVQRGRTAWGDDVAAITTRDGEAYLLYFRDGSSSFWAESPEVQIVKHYDRPQTIGGLKAYAEKAKKLADEGRSPPVAGCGHCRQLGHMCPGCEFDEYDM